MTTSAALWSFALVVGLLTLTPGLDTALVLRTAALNATRRAWGVVAGVQSGVLVWGVLTSAGITALLTASHLAYDVLRWAGACYLVWMGLTMVRGTRRRRRDPDAVTTSPHEGDPAQAVARATSHHDADAPEAGGFAAGWRRGLLTNLLNPKVGVFYVALLPQFVPPGAPVLSFGILLTCVHIALGLLWSVVLVFAARRLRQVLRRPAARTVMDRVTGTVIAGFGVKLAVSSH